VCQSIRPPSLRGWENQAIFAIRSPTAIKDTRPFRVRRKQIPETSLSGTSTTRLTRSLFLFDFRFPMEPPARMSQNETFFPWNVPPPRMHEAPRRVAASRVRFRKTAISQLFSQPTSLRLQLRLALGPENKVMLTILGAVAEFERAKIIERMMRGKVHGSAR
jgi:Resolvase, N terminal domain